MIRSFSERAIFSATIGNNNDAWIGLTDASNEGIWSWHDLAPVKEHKIESTNQPELERFRFAD